MKECPTHDGIIFLLFLFNLVKDVKEDYSGILHMHCSHNNITTFSKLAYQQNSALSDNQYLPLPNWVKLKCTN